MNTDNQTSSSEFKQQDEVLVNWHQMVFKTLRQREQEVIRYIAILAPALAGFVWLFRKQSCMEHQEFLIGVTAVIFLLTVGAVYCLALGYNFRCMILQLKRLESKLKIEDYALKKWQGIASKKSAPPEIIKVFLWSFVVAIFGVMVAAFVIRLSRESWWALSYLGVGIGALAFCCWLCHKYRKKITKLQNREEEDRKNGEGSGTSD